jgi:hypothetical protein
LSILIVRGHRLGRLLDEFVEDAESGVVLADAGVILARDPDTVRGPDLAFYSHDRIPESGYGVTFWGPPDLAVAVAPRPFSVFQSTRMGREPRCIEQTGCRAPEGPSFGT